MSASPLPPASGPIRLGDTLALPVDAVVETFAILGKRGRGKTTTAVVLAEEFISARLPVVVVDPLGVWWGLRASKDGTGEGLPVVIFGGDHADLPLTVDSGEVVADAIIDARFPAVLDLSHLSKPDMRQVMTAFVERLYRRNRDPLHVIFDEADLLAPQRTSPEGSRLLNGMIDLFRRGRVRGLGGSLISQRPAAVHKEVLSQAEVLVALGLTGPRDVAAIDEWVRLHADEDQAREVKQSLASLPVGTAWAWSPSWLDVLQKVKIRDRHTFDSSATPKPGVARPTATAFADIDKAALGRKIAALETAAHEVDPVVLRGRIADLERQLAAAIAAQRDQVEVPVEVIVEKRVEVPVLGVDDVTQMEAAVHALAERLAAARRLLDTPLDATAPAREPQIVQPSVPNGSSPPATPAPSSPSAARATATDRPIGAASDAASTNSRLPKAQRLILTALAQHGPRTATQVALLTAYSHKSGGFRNALSNLRSEHLIEGSGTTGLHITTEGTAVLGAVDPLPSGRDLLEWWKSGPIRQKAERSIVDVLAAHYPNPVDVDVIAAETGYSATSGGFRNALSRLRTLAVAVNAGPKRLVLSEQFA